MRKVKLSDILVSGATRKASKIDINDKYVQSIIKQVRDDQKEIRQRKTIDESQLNLVVKR